MGRIVTFLLAAIAVILGLTVIAIAYSGSAIHADARETAFWACIDSHGFTPSTIEAAELLKSPTLDRALEACQN